MFHSSDQSLASSLFWVLLGQMKRQNVNFRTRHEGTLFTRPSGYWLVLVAGNNTENDTSMRSSIVSQKVN